MITRSLQMLAALGNRVRRLENDPGASGGGTVKLSDYAVPDDGENDAVGFQNAVNDLKANKGGTLIVDGGVWNLDSMVNFSTPGNNYISYKVIGDGGSVIKLGLGQSGIGFYAGNTNQITLDNLIFTGDDSTAGYDCNFVLLSTYSEKTTIKNTQFFGIRAKHSLIYAGNTDMVIENTQFAGNASDTANVYGAFDLRGLTIENTDFRDYGNFLDKYYSKTPQGVTAWIMVERDAQTAVNYYAARVRLTDLRLDEGAKYGISIKNVPHVTADALRINVSGILNSAGIVLDNVKYADVKDSVFGYTTNSRPAIKLSNHTNVKATRLTFGNNVYFAELDITSSVDTALCAECLPL